MAEMKKILFFIIDLNSGGAEWQLARLTAALPSDEFDIQVVCMNSCGEVAAWLKNQSIPVKCLDYNKPTHIWNLLKLVKILRNFKPDIMHNWMFHANIIGKIIGKICGVKKIISSLRVIEKERPYHICLERWTAVLNTDILCNSNGLRNHMAEAGFPVDKLKVIPNSFDKARFHFNTKVCPKDNRWKLLFLGRISTQKGLIYLVEALKLLKESSINFRLDLYGTVENEKLYCELQAMISKYALDNYVKFNTSFSHEKINQLMSQSHLLLHPSLWEGMPNAVMEAMASGLPVIATDIEGTGELIEDLKMGLLAKPKDAHDLFSKISYAIANYEEIIDMSRAAYDNLLNNYSPETIHKQYVDYYRTIL